MGVKWCHGFNAKAYAVITFIPRPAVQKETWDGEANSDVFHVLPKPLPRTEWCMGLPWHSWGAAGASTL